MNLWAFFYKMSFELSINILRMLYFALIYPRILYAIEIYANTYLTHLHDLIILNNRILRIIQHQSIHEANVNLYKTFKTLPINKLFQYQMLLHAHAVMYRSETMPEIFQSKSQLNQDIHTHNTRASRDFHRSCVTSVYSNKISSNVIARLWNLLPINIKDERRSDVFKILVKQMLIDNDLGSSYP